MIRNKFDHLTGGSGSPDPTFEALKRLQQETDKIMGRKKTEKEMAEDYQSEYRALMRLRRTSNTGLK